MYSEFKNITIYKKQFEIVFKSGEILSFNLTEPFIITADTPAKFESDDGKYAIAYESKWIIIFDRKTKHYRRIFCPREVANLIYKFTVSRDTPFILEYCKHLFWKYDKKAINIFFSDKVSNEEEVIEWIRETIAPEHSMGTDNAPVAIVYRSMKGFYAHILKQNRLVADTHIPIAKGLSK